MFRFKGGFDGNGIIIGKFLILDYLFKRRFLGSSRGMCDIYYNRENLVRIVLRVKEDEVYFSYIEFEKSS